MKRTGLAQSPLGECNRCWDCVLGGTRTPSCGEPRPSMTIRMTWNGISLRFVMPRANDRCRGCVTALLARPHRRDRTPTQELQSSAGAAGCDCRTAARRCSRGGSSLGIGSASLNLGPRESRRDSHRPGEAPTRRASGHPLGGVGEDHHHPARRKGSASCCRRSWPAGDWAPRCTGRGCNSRTG